MTSDRATKKQQELLQFLEGFIVGHGYGPSYREIMRALGYKSVSTVAIHIDQLVVKGYVEKKDNSARSLQIITTRQPQTPVQSSEKNESVKQLESLKETLQSQQPVPEDDIRHVTRTLELLKAQIAS